MNEIKKLKDEEYFASAGLNNSFLKIFDTRSPAHAFIEPEPTARMALGSFYHCILLEPEKFNDEFVIAPPECLNRKNKPYPEFAKSIIDKEIALVSELENAEKIKNNLLNHELFEGIKLNDIYDKCQKEIAVFWEAETLDGEKVQKKAKLDILFETENNVFIFDLKTMTNCLDFEKKVFDNTLQYYRQAAWYSEGIRQLTGKETTFIFLTFEDKEPFGVMAYNLNLEYMAYAQMKNDKAVDKFLEWQKAGPDKTILYPSGVKTLTKPAFIN